MSTVATIIGYAEKVTSIDSSTIGIPGAEQAMLINIVDKANREYYNRFLRGIGEPKADMVAETGGTIVASTTLDGAVTSASTSIILDSVTGYATSGAGVIWDNASPDIVEYTGISTLTLTGVTGIGYNHEDADEFSVLYALPANFGSFRSTQDSPDGVEVDGVQYRFVTGTPYGNQFAEYNNGTTRYLFFPLGVTGDYSVRYNKKAATITATTDSIDVPVDDEDFIVYRVAEHIYDVVYGAGSTQSQFAHAQANRILLDALKRRNVGKRLKTGRSWGVNGRRDGIPLSEYQNSL